MRALPKITVQRVPGLGYRASTECGLVRVAQTRDAARGKLRAVLINLRKRRLI
jgi:hypothetical protein